MATAPRLKYPFVAGMGMTVYLVTANVTAAKIAAAASSRVLTISSSLVCGFAQKQKDARTRASWGHSGADPPQPSPHTDLPRSKSAGTGCRLQHLSADLERGLPSTPEFHRATAPERPILDRGSWMLDVSRLNPISRIQYPRSFRTRASRAVTADRESGRNHQSATCSQQSILDCRLPTADCRLALPSPCPARL